MPDPRQVTLAILAAAHEQDEWDRKRRILPPYRARKSGGSYQADGTVVAEFTPSAGARRCVFEFDTPAGLLHIFSMDQIKPIPPT